MWESEIETKNKLRASKEAYSQNLEDTMKSMNETKLNGKNAENNEQNTIIGTHHGKEETEFDVV